MVKKGAPDLGACKFELGCSELNILLLTFLYSNSKSILIKVILGNNKSDFEGKRKNTISPYGLTLVICIPPSRTSQIVPFKYRYIPTSGCHGD